ncbi:MAG TPA: hypothetical protein PLJ21_13735, partial [Pseudobdellovibrionaceae bacterium]|nr:hypothetical protein [Pseudobdellovibrionaceae bacterium]
MNDHLHQSIHYQILIHKIFLLFALSFYFIPLTLEAQSKLWRAKSLISDTSPSDFVGYLWSVETHINSNPS